MVKKFAHSQFPILENILWQQPEHWRDQCYHQICIISPCTPICSSQPFFWQLTNPPTSILFQGLRFIIHRLFPLFFVVWSNGLVIRLWLFYQLLYKQKTCRSLAKIANHHTNLVVHVTISQVSQYQLHLHAWNYWYLDQQLICLQSLLEWCQMLHEPVMLLLGQCQVLLIPMMLMMG